jgi:hypothetical protein
LFPEQAACAPKHELIIKTKKMKHKKYHVQLKGPPLAALAGLQLRLACLSAFYRQTLKKKRAHVRKANRRRKREALVISLPNLDVNGPLKVA